MDKPVEHTPIEGASAAHEAAFAELERSVRAALETYSNVHRGTGHNSIVSTALFEHAREIVLDYLKLDRGRYVVIFCTPWALEMLKSRLKAGIYHIVSSREIGLPLGMRALAVEKKALPKGVPFQTGGEVVKLVSPNSVVWADVPHKFEAGTPSIVNVIAFAKALQVIACLGDEAFRTQGEWASTAAEILDRDALPAYSGKELLHALRKELVGRGVLVPTAEGQRPYINFDNGASTPTFSPIWDAVCRTWRQPEAVRSEIVREVREACAAFLGAPLDAYDIFFTCNTSEALNLAAWSLERDGEKGVETVVVNTLLEHHSNELPWRYLPGVSLIRFPVDAEGFVDLAALEALLREYNAERAHGTQRIRLVAVSGASNVLGSFNDIRAIGRIAHRYGARILVDGAQLVAHRKVAMQEDGIDYLAFSGHKMYAPFGSGALVVRKGLLRFAPVELAAIRASGEENVVGIAALGKAIALLQRVGMDVIEEEERAITRRALEGLSRIPDIEVFGVRDPASPRFRQKGSVIAFTLKRAPYNLVAQELVELGGIGVRTGCFCAHLISKRLLKIHPLRSTAAEVGLAILPRFTAAILPGLVRVSFGIENEGSEVDTLIQALERIAATPQSGIDRLAASTRNGTPCLPRTEVQDRIEAFTAARIERVYASEGENPLNAERQG